MNVTKATGPIDQDRRQLMGTAAIGIAAASAGSLVSSQSTSAAPSDTIRPFRYEATHEQLAAPRRRIAATGWPDKEQVGDESQGVRLATVQQLARYWQTSHDWRKVEARLNALPQFMTEIDGLDIHFIHVRSRHEN